MNDYAEIKGQSSPTTPRGMKNLPPKACPSPLTTLRHAARVRLGPRNVRQLGPPIFAKTSEMA